MNTNYKYESTWILANLAASEEKEVISSLM